MEEGVSRVAGETHMHWLIFFKVDHFSGITAWVSPGLPLFPESERVWVNFFLRPITAGSEEEEESVTWADPDEVES